MAIQLLQSSIVQNYDVSPDQKFYQGDALVFDTSNPVNATGFSPVKVNAGAITSVSALVGFSTTDHNVIGNTLIQNDPVGSSVVNAAGNVFSDYSNGFYVGAKRAIGDFQDETVAVTTNLTAVSASGNPTPLRRASVVRQHGTQFVTDRFDSGGTYTTLGTPLYCQAAGLSSSNASSAVAVARCDYYDSTSNLIYVTIVA